MFNVYPTIQSQILNFQNNKIFLKCQAILKQIKENYRKFTKIFANFKKIFNRNQNQLQKIYENLKKNLTEIIINY